MVGAMYSPELYTGKTRRRYFVVEKKNWYNKLTFLCLFFKNIYHTFFCYRFFFFLCCNLYFRSKNTEHFLPASKPSPMPSVRYPVNVLLGYFIKMFRFNLLYFSVCKMFKCLWKMCLPCFGCKKWNWKTYIKLKTVANSGLFFKKQQKKKKRKSVLIWAKIMWAKSFL